MPERAHIAIGSNLHDRPTYLAAGLAAVAALPNPRVTAVSSIYETPPLGPLEQPDYLNAVLAVETLLAPEELLASMLQIEKDHLRQRHIHWGPRTLDLD
ncbi:MAG: 2-amino-4-hydroxy-6-hydroxymethyldihydropteridine diphosphokinase, partial [Candidatus Latescibacterota bacterium]|nr:2-amino-4-hydroxy-6-hydroxymethyldihydropteridine diphosphokinase [Candidatus Latescibacterota bacterium]